MIYLTKIMRILVLSVLRYKKDIKSDKTKNSGKALCPTGVLTILLNEINYPPKLSYIMELSSTPRSVSIATTAFDIGPGPHM